VVRVGMRDDENPLRRARIRGWLGWERRRHR
jgi:hypothetical protein